MTSANVVQADTGENEYDTENQLVLLLTDARHEKIEESFADAFPRSTIITPEQNYEDNLIDIFSKNDFTGAMIFILSPRVQLTERFFSFLRSKYTEKPILLFITSKECQYWSMTSQQPRDVLIVHSTLTFLVHLLNAFVQFSGHDIIEYLTYTRRQLDGQNDIAKADKKFSFFSTLNKIWIASTETLSWSVT